MRPLPVIVLSVALVCALVVGLFFVGRDHEGDRAPAASAAAEADAAAEPAETPSLEATGLDATGSSSPDPERSAPAVTDAPRDPSRLGNPPKKVGPTVLLTGRVLGNLGKPVEGASVYAAESIAAFGLNLDEIDSDGLGGAPWIRRVEAKTDADGRFQIRPEARSKIYLSFRAPGFAPLDREFALPGSERDLGDLVLDASAILSGRVVDPNGRGVAGARIARVSGTGPVLAFGGERGATVARTDALGSFRVDQLAAGPWRLLVTHADHPDHLETGETDRPGAEQSGLIFTLDAGSEIQGRVVGAPAGAPAKLTVRAAPHGGEDNLAVDSPPVLVPAARTAGCAADGSFVLKGLKVSQKYRLTAQEGVRDFYRGTRSLPVIARAGDRGIELAYKPETAIVFQVVDATSGAPVVDLSVQAGWNFTMPLLDDEGRAMRRFPEGRVRFGGLAPSARAAAGIVPAAMPAGAGGGATGLKLRIESPGYEVLERSDIALSEGQDTDLGVLRLDRAPAVAVLVLDDATGEPIADAAVSLEEVEGVDRRAARFSFRIEEDTDEAAGERVHGSAQRARTGADGWASVTSLPGKTARISVEKSGYARHRGEPIALPLHDIVERTIRLGPGGSVTVEVVDSRGAPVSGAEVDHETPEQGEGQISFGDSGERTDTDGRVVFENLASGEHRFRLGRSADGGFIDVGGGHAFVRGVSRAGGGAEVGWSSIEVDERTAATIRLVLPERGTLAGRVTEGGQPLANATLRLSPKSEDETPMPFRSGGRSAHTDVRGDYLFDGVDEGEYSLSVEHPTRAMAFEAKIEVRPGENRQDIDLAVAIVEGTVTGEDGKPVAGVRVRAERAPVAGRRRPMAIMVMATSDGGDEPEVNVSTEASGAPVVTTDAEGRYSLRGVLPDVELVVEADAKDAQPARSGKFSVGLDEVKKGVDLKLERGGTIQVSVQNQAGKPAGGFLARATFEGGSTMPKVQMIGPNGSVKLTGLKPGKWRVVLDPLQDLGAGGGEAPIPEREVDVVVGETAKADFVVP